MPVAFGQQEQSRPSGTSAVTLLSRAGGSAATEVKQIFVCNTSGAAADFSIYYDADGTTYDETTALYFSEELASHKTHVVTFEEPVKILSDSSSIGVQTSVSNALTFTVIGKRQ